jgi:hypothetical protein
MPVHIIMDRHGDSRHFFDPADARSLLVAEARFKKLVGKGFRAVAPGEHGQPGSLLHRFDESIEKTLFIPPLEGG